MLLTINAPHIERQLQRAAEQQNTTPAELAERLLAASLTIPSGEVEANQQTETGNSAERKERFHRLLEVNRQLQVAPLESAAFNRDSFYEDERHLDGDAAIGSGLASR